MRNLELLLVTFLVSLGSCEAQSANSKSLEPSSIGVVFFLDSSNQTLKPLPDEAWKAQGSGFITGTGSIVVSGERSSFRITAKDKPEFVFKIGNPENTQLHLFTQKKKKRQFELAKAKGRSREIIPGIPVEITKFGESSFKLTPHSSLSPGEYAILTGSKIFSFGIDQ